MMANREKKRVMAHGGVEVTFEGTPQGIGLLGTNGSGKTLCYRMALKSLLTDVGQLCVKAVLYDYKMEFLPIVAGLGVPMERIKILNPLDERGVAFSIIREIGSDTALAPQIAQALLPDDRGDNQPYFVRASRELVTALLRVFMRRATEAHLNDVIEVARDPVSLAGALMSDPQEQAVAQTYLASLEKAYSILSTLQTKLAPFGPVAAALRRNPNQFDLAEWLADPEPGILIVGSDVTYSAAMAPLNAVFFDRLIQRLLARSGEGMTRRDEVWLGFEELPTLPKLERLPELARVGRWSRAPLLWSAQTVESVLEIFGQQAGYDLLAEAAPNIAFTSPNSPATRAYLASLMGRAPLEHTGVGESWSQGGRSTSSNSSMHPGMAAFDSSFLHMGKPSKKTGIPIIARAVGTGLWKTVVKPSFTRKWLAPESKRPEHVGYRRRSTEWTEPLPLTLVDRERLGIGERPASLDAAFGRTKRRNQGGFDVL